MSYNIIPTPHFEKAVKGLMKRYRSLKSDLKVFFDSLSENPMQGDELCPGIRKIRMAITSKGRGKSGGARVITYTIVAAEHEGQVYLIDIYDKSDYSTVNISILQQIIKELKL